MQQVVEVDEVLVVEGQIEAEVVPEGLDLLRSGIAMPENLASRVCGIT